MHDPEVHRRAEAGGADGTSEAAAQLGAGAGPQPVLDDGRARGYVAAFGLSRIAFREMALMGLIPGRAKGILVVKGRA